MYFTQPLFNSDDYIDIISGRMVLTRKGKKDVEYSITDIAIEPVEPGDTHLYILDLVYGEKNVGLSLFLPKEKFLRLARSMEKIK